MEFKGVSIYGRADDYGDTQAVIKEIKMTKQSKNRKEQATLEKMLGSGSRILLKIRHFPLSIT